MTPKTINMRNSMLLLLLTCLFSCNNGNKKPNLIKPKSNTKECAILNVEFSNLGYPFGQKMRRFQRDSVRNFETGDCWGNISQWSKGALKLGVDSTFCGDYGFQYRFYLFCKDNVVVTHQQNAETLFAEAASYVFTESIYDYREKPFRYYVRSDTLQINDFGALKTDFKKELLGVTQENAQADYLKAWLREVY